MIGIWYFLQSSRICSPGIYNNNKVTLRIKSIKE